MNNEEQLISNTELYKLCNDPEQRELFKYYLDRIVNAANVIHLNMFPK